MISDVELSNTLYGRLWHTTHPDRYQSILKEGSILPNPPIPDHERWKTEEGPDAYPYVRTLGGVSLFDFCGFNVETYSANYPASSWWHFVPYRKCWGVAIWIEIDRQKIARKFLSGEELLAKWKREQAYKHTIMPKIEAAHLGPIPLQAIRRVLKIGIADLTFVEVEANLARTLEGRDESGGLTTPCT